MRILSLRLLNFRQHADSEIHFGPGLTGIIGPNGAGKSTILEAIAWALYGAEAARGTNDTIRFARAGARSRVEVELRFTVGGQEYRVVRTLNNAEVFLADGSAPVATTLGGVTRYLQAMLGMSRREFFNTYFTGQKELQFLAAMGSAERGRFLSQVLGYERLRQAQELARARRSELRHEINGLRAAMGDLDAILEERTSAEVRLREAQDALAEAQTMRTRAEETLAGVAPHWADVQQARDRHRELSHAIEAAEREREAARRDLVRIDAELERTTVAERELSALRARLAVLPDTVREGERLAELSRTNERRKALAEQGVELRAELQRSTERLARIEQAPQLLERYASELETTRAEQLEVEEALDARKTAWLRDRQDAETKLLSFRDRGAELKEQIRQIREAGPAGKCPTCERALGADFERLLGALEDQWRNVVQDGKWWKSRRDQLEPRPQDLTALETRLATVVAAANEKARKHARCEGAVQELRTLQEEHAKRAARLAELERQLAAIPTGYDPVIHREAESRLKELRTLEKQAARLEESAGRRVTLERDRQAARATDTVAAERRLALEAERSALGFSEEAFAAVRTEHEHTSEALRQAELRAVALQGEVRSSEQALASALRAEERYREQAREVEQREDELRHHNELDAALSELRTELNTRVRPELSEIASSFLAQLTDGRYTALEISESYDILVLDEGEEKPVISGGEEDIANLVLRLSLSQMIAERAGHPLSLLILDEVFGSLDIARRDNVVQLLRRLEDRFEQVILITHIEGIREALDQVLRVDFDERTGASTVREESLPGAGPPNFGMAAD
ncbi:MAG: SMC family ATPase [Gemmatimonadetes bacterium]|nr:SMC family ATPase [Gemmatimonadota bacterium]